MLLPTENIGEGSFSQSRDKCKNRPAGHSGRKLKQQWHVCCNVLRRYKTDFNEEKITLAMFCGDRKLILTKRK